MTLLEEIRVSSENCNNNYYYLKVTIHIEETEAVCQLEAYIHGLVLSNLI